MHRINVQTATLAQLKGLAKDGGRIRFRDGHLYVRPHRSPNRLNRAIDSVLGLTTTKRAGVLAAVQLICKRNDVDIDVEMRSGLSGPEFEKLGSFQGDLKSEHLDKMLDTFVRVGDELLVKGKVLGKGAYGEVIEATGDDGRRLALKKMIKPKAGTPGAQHIFEAALQAQKREVAAHQLAMNFPAEDGVSYVVDAKNLVTGPRGTVYQPMDLAVGGGDASINRDRKAEKLAIVFERKPRGKHRMSAFKRAYEGSPQLSQDPLDKNGKKPAMKLMVRDWVEGLRQLKRAGLAHRDIKPENFLLCTDGYWKVTDFGTSGAENHVFQAHAGAKGFKLTGNPNPFAKSPEWLKSELPGSNDAFNVEHKDDVFSLGIGVFRSLSGGRFPFDGTQENPGDTVGSVRYEENVLAFAAGKMPFCDWYENHTGLTIPKEWQAFLNGALHGDPEKRLSADQIRDLAIFQDEELDKPELRQRMVEEAAW